MNRITSSHGAKRAPFTLIEMLVVISIILIVLGTAISGQKRLANDSSLVTRHAALQQLVNETVESSKRLRVPQQIYLDAPADEQTLQTKPCEIHGGAGSLVSYWGFNEMYTTDPGKISHKGILGQTLYVNGVLGDLNKDEGYLGSGVRFDVGTGMLQSNNSHLIRFPNGAYFEAWIKPNWNEFGPVGTKADVVNVSPVIRIEKVQNGFAVWGAFGSDTVPSEAPKFNTADEPRPVLPNDDQWHKVGLIFGQSNKGSTPWSPLGRYHVELLTPVYKPASWVCFTSTGGYFESTWGTELDPNIDNPPMKDEDGDGKFEKFDNSKWKPVYLWQMSIYVDDRFVAIRETPPWEGMPEFNATSGKVWIGDANYRGLIDEVRVINLAAGRTVTTDPRNSVFKAAPYHGNPRQVYLNISPRGLPEMIDGQMASFSVVSTVATGTVKEGNVLLPGDKTGSSNLLRLGNPKLLPQDTVIRFSTPSPGSFVETNGFVYLGEELIAYRKMVWNKTRGLYDPPGSWQGYYELVGCSRGYGGTTACGNLQSFLSPAFPVFVSKSGGTN